MFTTAIRTIRQAEAASAEGDSDFLRQQAAQATNFLLQVSPTLKAVFYNAAKLLHPKELQALDKLGPRSMIQLFAPSEVTSILGLTYLYRRLRKRAPSAEWDKVASRLHQQIELGMYVGASINHIGQGYGILLGGIRYLSLLTFAIDNSKSFADHMRKVKARNRLFDLEAEQVRFSCTHLQVGAQLVQGLGFGTDIGYGVVGEMLNLSQSKFPERLEELIICWRTALSWTESFHLTGEPPEGDGAAELAELPEDDTNILRTHASRIQDEGASDVWISAKAEELAPATREALCIKTKSGKKATKEATSNTPEAEEDLLESDRE
jgi:hypothetical protein